MICFSLSFFFRFCVTGFCKKSTLISTCQGTDNKKTTKMKERWAVFNMHGGESKIFCHFLMKSSFWDISCKIYMKVSLGLTKRTKHFHMSVVERIMYTCRRQHHQPLQRPHPYRVRLLQRRAMFLDVITNIHPLRLSLSLVCRVLV